MEIARYIVWFAINFKKYKTFCLNIVFYIRSKTLSIVIIIHKQVKLIIKMELYKISRHYI